MSGQSAIPGKRKSESVDWNAIKARLESLRLALEGLAEPSDAEVKQLLQARARALARPAQRSGEAGARLHVLEFEIAQERYALETRLIREVYPLKMLTVLPGASAFFPGLVNWRGRVLSLIDLKRFFELPDKGITELNRVVVVSNGSVELGLLADAVVETRWISVEKIQPSLPTLGGIRTAYLRGVTGERLVVLDGGKILADARLAGSGRGRAMESRQEVEERA